MEIQIFPLVLSSHVGGIRDDARQVFLLYLTKYPITVKRFQNVLCEKIVGNLSYEYEDGQLSCLKLLYSLLDSISIETYGESVEFLFMNFILYMGNLESHTSIEVLGECTRKLIESATSFQKHQHSLLKLTRSFLTHTDHGDQQKHLTILSSTLRAISFAPKIFLQLIDSSQLNAAIQQTLDTFPCETMWILHRLLQNDFKIENSFWENFILLDFVSVETISNPIRIISWQLKIFCSFFSTNLHPYTDKMLKLCLGYLFNSALISCQEDICSLLLEMLKHQYSTEDPFCVEICKQIFAKFRIPQMDIQFFNSMYLFCTRFYAAAISFLIWEDKFSTLNESLMLISIKYLYFIDWNKKR